MASADAFRIAVQGKDAEHGFELGRGQGKLHALLQNVRRAFGKEAAGAVGLTDGDVVLDAEEKLAALVQQRREENEDGLRLFLFDPRARLGHCRSERISFVPHPRTITAAGDLEYFASKGKHTVSYALAELIDNALSATQHLAFNRAIRIVFEVKGSRACMYIEDNGVGMTKREINEWAVMNLSKSDRSKGRSRDSGDSFQDISKSDEAGTRFLFSDLSFFGVGSKNACFFLGHSVRATSKRSSGCFVHDLHLTSKALEDKYASRQNAYEADLMHRGLGDTSTLSEREAAFPQVLGAVRGECGSAADADRPTMASTQSGSRRSFTRLLVSDLKPDVVAQVQSQESCQQICSELAHIYHFYLHGTEGFSTALNEARDGTESQACKLCKLPDGSALPNITLESYRDNRRLCSIQLCDVEDDVMTTHLKSQRSEFSFSMEVPTRGRVDGVLYYFPFDSERETLPGLDAGATDDSQKSKRMSSSPEGLTQRQQGMTQATQPSMTQHATQMHTQRFLHTNPEEDFGLAPQGSPRHHMFETFWQGRLIPESHVQSLPFIDALWHKHSKSTNMKDRIPGEAFSRIWGCLFFGPEFHVTRNKLSFRDRLEDLLGASITKQRNLEKRFQEWLARCHAELDKSILFQSISAPPMQARIRSKFGEHTTSFDKICMARENADTLTLSQGDVVLLRTQPKLVGRVLSFVVKKVMRGDGNHSSGFMAVQRIPEEIYGGMDNTVYVPLRRLECKLSAREVEEHTKKQWMKAPSSLGIEPLVLATGKVQKYTAGEDFPPVSIHIFNGMGQKMTKGVINGAKQSLSVTQKLYLLEDTVSAEGREGREGREEGEEGEDADEGGAGRLKQELLCVTNTQPKGDTFMFQKVQGGFKKAGLHVMQFTVDPPTHDTHTKLEIKCVVKAGDADRMEMSTEQDWHTVRLGEAWAPIHLRVFDGLDNLIDGRRFKRKDLRITCEAESNKGADKECPQLIASTGRCTLAEDGIRIDGFHVLPNPESHAPLYASRARTHLSQAKVNPIRCKATIAVSRGKEGKESVSLSTKMLVYPGVPSSLDYAPGSELHNNSQSNPLQLCQGAHVPPVILILTDQYGNRTQPPKDLIFTVHADCRGLSPECKSFDVSDTGVAHVQGFVADSHEAAELKLRLQSMQAGSVPETACTMGGNANAILERSVWIQVEPSTTPEAMLPLRNGEPMPKDPNGSDDYVLGGIQAGSSVSDLSVAIQDGSGRPAVCGKHARLTVSWVKGTKQCTVRSDATISLPPLPAQDDCASPVSFWARVIVDGIQLETSLLVQVRPGPPYSWAVCAENSEVQSGVPFVITVEAVDKYQNKCMGTGSQLPTPLIVPRSERALQFDPNEWEAGWRHEEGDGGSTYVVTMVLHGAAGPIAIHIDSDTTLNLNEDIWHVPLLAGPPARLRMRMQNEKQKFFTTCFIEAILVDVLDAFGNPLNCDDIEIVLQPSAMSENGLAATVSSQKGNRKRANQGVAEFQAVKLACPEAGNFTLQANCASRKLAIAEATLRIDVARCNRVRGLDLSVSSERITAGEEVTARVAIATEDAQALPEELVLSKLHVAMVHNGGADAGIGGGRGGGGGGDGGGDVARSDLAECEASLKFDAYDKANAVATFRSARIACAGSYAVTACYEETRSSLACVLPKNEVVVQSMSVTVVASPAPPHQLALVAPPEPPLLHASNARAGPRGEGAAEGKGKGKGESAGEGEGEGTSVPLLVGAVFQVEDRYGNACALAHVALSLHLYRDEALQEEIRGGVQWDGHAATAADGRCAMGAILLSAHVLDAVSTHSCDFFLAATLKHAPPGAPPPPPPAGGGGGGGGGEGGRARERGGVGGLAEDDQLQQRRRRASSSTGEGG